MANKKRTNTAVIIVPVLAAGTVAAIAAYQNGAVFEPSGKSRDLKNNQVVFSEDDDAAASQEESSGDDSAVWERDPQAEEQSGQQDSAQADYLFEDLQSVEIYSAPSDSAVGTTSHPYTDSTGGLAEPYIDSRYRLTNDTGNADLIVRTPSDEAGGAGTADGASSAGQTTEPGNSSSTQPQQPATDTDSDTNDTNGGNGGNGNAEIDDPGNADDPTPDPTPSVRPADLVSDPVSTKSAPSSDDGYINRTYTEETASQEGWHAERIVISTAVDAAGSGIYKGQTVDAATIFNSLYTFVWGSDGVRYLWGEEALDQYVRIEAISLDDGETWIDEFPTEISADTETDTMLIKTAYRLSLSDEEWTAQEVSYPLYDSRVFVLSEAVAEGSTELNTDTILNTDQNIDVGTKINLFFYQTNFMDSWEPLTELFPGWTENGKTVSWFYEVSAGRHILEPADMVPLEDCYTVQLMFQWMSEEYEVSTDYTNLCYLQTLTNFEVDAVTKSRNKRTSVEVPQYVQAIVIDSDADLKVDYLSIPDTVVYIADNSASLLVRRGYVVDEDNPFYKSTEDGLLYNKAGNELCGIPYSTASLTVDASVEKVTIPEKNRLTNVTLAAGSVETLPTMQFERLSHCKILVDESLLDEFLEQKYEEITKGEDNCVASVQDPDTTYTVKNNMIISDAGTVRKAFSTGDTTLSLPDGAREIQAGAFSECTGAQRLILPKDGAVVKLSAGDLAECGITQIWCYSEAQYKEAKKRVEMLGDSGESFEICLLEVSQEGYTYCLQDENGEETAVLVSVPSDLVSFDGTVTANNADATPIAVTEIASRAFAGCSELQWVYLPESVKQIGYQAFLNDISLQGILIDSKDTITIADQAFAGCSALRFAASNAMEAVMENDYDPLISDSYIAYQDYYYFFVPTGATGYTSHSTNFTEESGVYGYRMEDIGGGCMMLFGVDADGNAWLGLRSGANVADEVTLPDTVYEIFNYAMADTVSPSGSYTVNWPAQDQFWLDNGVFENSDLGGDVVLGENFTVGSEAFAGCENITSMEIPGWGISVGESAFSGCTSLTQVTFGSFASDAELYPGVFTACSQLTDLTFAGYTVPTLALYGEYGFLFNSYWFAEEEAQNLKIHVPEGMEEEVVSGWRYAMAGYTGAHDTPAYLQMRAGVLYNHINWETGEYPTDDEVDVYLAEELLDAENRIRTMLGIPTVSEPTNLYQYHENNGYLTLVSVPSDAEYVFLDAETVGLPEGWYIDYIGSGAFSKAANLQTVVISDGLSGIYSNAFAGVESETLNLVMNGETPPSLLADAEGTEFSFGIAEENLMILIPEGSLDAYMQAWKTQLLGYTDEEALKAAVALELTDEEGAPTDEEVQAEAGNRMEAAAERLENILMEW